MKDRKWRVSADLPSKTRALILRQYQPRFGQTHLRSITWAYGVPECFPFDPQPMRCRLIGMHVTQDHEAFVAELDGITHRPDGRQLFLALSTAPGIPPISAGEIDPALVQPISPITFAMALKLHSPGKAIARTWQQAA